MPLIFLTKSVKFRSQCFCAKSKRKKFLRGSLESTPMAQTCSYYIGSKDERTISHRDKSIKVDCTANHIFEVTQWVIGVSKWKVEIWKGVSKVQSCNIKKSRLEVF